jgi:SAM-dependent methyltransferase
LVPFLFVFIVVLGKKKPREKKGLIRQGNTLFVHAHYRGFSFNWQHEALNVSDAPVERQERASMLFVFPENVTGAGIVVALTRGFGRAITIAYKHPHYPREYLRLRNENDAREFLDITNIENSPKPVHANLYVSESGLAQSRLAAANIGAWNISQRNGDGEGTTVMGSIDLGVDNVLTEMVPADISAEFPRNPDPVYHGLPDPAPGQGDHAERLAFIEGSETLIDAWNSGKARLALSAKQRDMLCMSPNAFAPPPRVYLYKQLYFFAGNGMFFVSVPSKREKKKRKRYTSRPHVYGVGRMQRAYALALSSLRLEGKTVLDIGSGMGFVSLYALIEGRAQAAMMMDVDYNYLNVMKKVFRRKDFAFLKSPEFNRTGLKFHEERFEVVDGKGAGATPAPFTSADVVVATGMVHTMLLCEKTRRKDGANGLLMSMERVIRQLALRTKETLVVEFLDADDPTVAWAGGYNRSARTKLTLPSRRSFASMLSAYFSNVDVLGHPTPTRTLFLATMHRREVEAVAKSKEEGGAAVSLSPVYRPLPVPEAAPTAMLTAGHSDWRFVERPLPPPLGRRSVLLGIVVDDKVKYMQQALSWLYTLRWNGGQLNVLSSVMVCVLPSVPSQFRERVRELGGIVRQVDPLSTALPGVTAHSNKIRFFEQPEVVGGKYRTVVYMDCDTLVLDDFFEMLVAPPKGRGAAGGTRGAMTAKFRAGRTTWGQFVLSDPVWQRTFELAGAVRRGEASALLAKTWPNTGVLVFSSVESGAMKRFVDSWIGLTDKVYHWLQHMREDAYFTETLSFLFALLETDMAYELLPVQMNCQLNFPKIDFLRNGYSDTLLAFPPAVVQYPKNTIHWSRHGYVGDLSASPALLKDFPFTAGLHLGRINQYYDQGHGGPPLFYGIHAAGAKGAMPMVVDFLIAPLYVQLERGIMCQPLSPTNARFLAVHAFLVPTTAGRAAPVVTRSAYDRLREDIAVHCQAGSVAKHAMVEWFDEGGDRLPLQELQDLQDAVDVALAKDRSSSSIAAGDSHYAYPQLRLYAH